jgi:anaerobic selenocysteine-containing dehydrogenase
MELNRRNFIKFLVGGVAGLHITPLPWKLTDDIAIWTQNWPWVPVPPVGAFTQVKSVCTLCPGGCGIEVRKVDTRAVKIEGRTDYPVNPGGICPLGVGGLQLLYNESIRHPQPMKRVGPRGSGLFVGISWKEALDMLAGRISALRQAERPQALAAIDGTPIRSTLSVLIERFLTAAGSPNTVRIPSAEDTHQMVNTLMQGTDGPAAVDLENSDYILSFGSGLLEGWGAPGRIFNAWSQWRDKPGNPTAKVVQIEPRASNTASKADQWVAIKPGTEAALALGMAHVIIKEGWFDSGFLNGYCFGFEDFRTADARDHIGFKTLVMEQYAPEKVQEITGIKAAAVVSLAKDFAEAKAPVAICGKGKGTYSGDLYEYMAVNSLNALKGRINRPGGVLVHEALPLSPLPEVQADETASKGLNTERIDGAGSKRYPFSHSLINQFTDAIVASAESPVDTLLVFSANPAYTLPDGGAFKKALMKIPFVVSFSPYRDETSLFADLVLPDHTYLEKMEEAVWPNGLQYPLYGLSSPVVEPVYHTRHTGDALITLAKQVGGGVASAFPWKGYGDVLKARAKGLFKAGGGLVTFEAGTSPVWELQKKGESGASDFDSFDDMWEKLKSGGLWYRTKHTYENWSTLFKTPTGKFEFSASKLELAFKDINPGIAEDTISLPHYEAPKAKGSSSYPLMMIPYEMINLSSSWIPSPPFLYKTLFDDQLLKNDSFAEINPKTAQEYQLKAGDQVVIKSPVGQIKARVKLFEGAMPGVVFLPLGFGHTAYDEFSKGKGSNPNDIVYAGKDPVSGHPIWWHTPVNLIKA